MALIKTYTSNAGVEYIDAYHAIRNLKIERNNETGVIPGTERGYYIVVDMEVFATKEDREKGYPPIDILYSNIRAILSENPKNFTLFVEEPDLIPQNIITYTYNWLKTRPIYDGAIDV